MMTFQKRKKIKKTQVNEPTIKDGLLKRFPNGQFRPCSVAEKS